MDSDFKYVITSNMNTRFVTKMHELMKCYHVAPYRLLNWPECLLVITPCSGHNQVALSQPNLLIAFTNVLGEVKRCQQIFQSTIMAHYYPEGKAYENMEGNCLERELQLRKTFAKLRFIIEIFVRE